MPELPEVETTVRGLRTVLVGLECVGVRGVDWPRMLPNTSEEMLSQVLVSDRVSAVGRRGKYLTLEFQNGPLLVIHRKMAGNVLLMPASAPLERHTHLAVAFSGDVEIRLVDPRKFSRVYLFVDPDEARAFFSLRLGLDPLEELTLAELRRLLALRRGRLKSVLLDQRTFPGWETSTAMRRCGGHACIRCALPTRSREWKRGDCTSHCGASYWRRSNGVERRSVIIATHQARPENSRITSTRMAARACRARAASGPSRKSWSVCAGHTFARGVRS